MLLPKDRSKTLSRKKILKPQQSLKLSFLLTTQLKLLIMKTFSRCSYNAVPELMAFEEPLASGSCGTAHWFAQAYNPV